MLLYVLFSLILLCFVKSQNISPYAPCPSNFNVCNNGGICMILFGRDVSCTCPSGYSGKAKFFFFLIV